MRGVAGKCQTAEPGRAATGSGSGAGWLENTIHRSGTVTWKANSAFRSGCSKFA